MAGGEPAKKSDLGVRTLSAVVMLAVAGTALWLGGWWWIGFVLLIGAVCYFEFARLVSLAFQLKWVRSVWFLLGFGYIAISAIALAGMRNPGVTDVTLEQAAQYGMREVILLVGIVICTDIGAYFSGRTIGGPKIAPAISPSKTWAGLLGGMALAGIWGFLLVGWPESVLVDVSGDMVVSLKVKAFASASSLAIVAQTGDFFESWLKRRAGVKDSSGLIPGHGGIFDRIDGLLPVALVSGLFGDWLLFIGWAAP